MSKKHWCTLSIVAALCFLAPLPLPFKVGLKWLAIAFLALLALHQRQRFLAVALFLHSIGDVVLAINKQWLLVSILPFMAGHICYCILFLKDVSNWRLSVHQKIFATVFCCYAIVLVALLSRYLPLPITCAIGAYGGVVCAMVIFARIAEYDCRWILLGAVLYAFSDSLIAITAFVKAIPGSHYITWSSYYLGQFLIAIGFLSEKHR